MPDDASGNFSLVSGYLAVTGQTVQPSNHNPPLEDIAASMTNRLSRSGVAPMTGPLKTVTGSASVPAIYPNSNPAIGIYWTPTGVSFAGSVSGVRFIGELIPYTLLTAPALTVFPYGQTLLRASYPDLWALAQTEIAAGNTFYNNGNGITTFGIGDLRGRVIVGKDNMGGTAASRMTTAGSGVDGLTLGAAGGLETDTLSLAKIPTGITGINSNSFTVTVTETSGYTAYNSGSSSLISAAGGGVAGGVSVTGAAVDRIQSSGTVAIGQVGFQSNNTGGAAHNNTQPTIICNYLLYAGA